MIENIYVMFDKGANIALKPLIVQRNDVIPVRELGELVNNSETIIHKHPQDFQIIHIGSIDLENLVVEQCEPRIVAVGLDLLPKKD